MKGMNKNSRKGEESNGMPSFRVASSRKVIPLAGSPLEAGRLRDSKRGRKGRKEPGECPRI